MRGYTSFKENFIGSISSSWPFFTSSCASASDTFSRFRGDTKSDVRILGWAIDGVEVVGGSWFSSDGVEEVDCDLEREPISTGNSGESAFFLGCVPQQERRALDVAAEVRVDDDIHLVLFFVLFLVAMTDVRALLKHNSLAPDP